MGMRRALGLHRNLQEQQLVSMHEAAKFTKCKDQGQHSTKYIFDANLMFFCANPSPAQPETYSTNECI